MLCTLSLTPPPPNQAVSDLLQMSLNNGHSTCFTVPDRCPLCEIQLGSRGSFTTTLAQAPAFRDWGLLKSAFAVFRRAVYPEEEPTGLSQKVTSADLAVAKKYLDDRRMHLRTRVLVVDVSLQISNRNPPLQEFFFEVQ